MVPFMAGCPRRPWPRPRAVSALLPRRGRGQGGRLRHRAFFIYDVYGIERVAELSLGLAAGDRLASFTSILYGFPVRALQQTDIQAGRLAFLDSEPGSPTSRSVPALAGPLFATIAGSFIWSIRG